MVGQEHCSSPGCTQPVHARGLCQMHYDRMRKRNGRPPASPSRCTVPGCGKPHHAHGLCQSHYDAMRKGGSGGGLAQTAEAARASRTGRCSVEGCTAPHHAKGYCKSHYSQLRRRGTVEDRTGDSNLCEIAGCSAPAVGNRRCEEHLRERPPGSPPLVTKAERIAEIRRRHELMRHEIERIKQSFEAESEDEE